MLGFGYIKAPPTTYLLHYSGGKLKREGAGISFWCFRYNSVLAKFNVSSTDVPFVFTEMTADVQDATIQGDLTFRIVDAKKTASLLNFSLDARERYLSDDPDKLNISLDLLQTLLGGEPIVGQPSVTQAEGTGQLHRRKGER
ncbi:MAG: hypothetical protein ABI557_15685 [Aureliella sp.]